MPRSLPLDPPRPATPFERAAITEEALAREVQLVIPGEDPMSEEEIARSRTYYAGAHMSIYPVRESTARLCMVTGATVPFYTDSFGWEYSLWLCTVDQEWQRLDYGDTQIVPSAVEP